MTCHGCDSEDPAIEEYLDDCISISSTPTEVYVSGAGSVDSNSGLMEKWKHLDSDDSNDENRRLHDHNHADGIEQPQSEEYKRIDEEHDRQQSDNYDMIERRQSGDYKTMDNNHACGIERQESDDHKEVNDTIEWRQSDDYKKMDDEGIDSEPQQSEQKKSLFNSLKKKVPKVAVSLKESIKGLTQKQRSSAHEQGLMDP